MTAPTNSGRSGKILDGWQPYLLQLSRSMHIQWSNRQTPSHF